MANKINKLEISNKKNDKLEISNKKNDKLEISNKKNDKLEISNKKIDIDSKYIDTEFKKQFDFIMDNSMELPLEFIKKSQKKINRNENVEKIDKIINCISISHGLERGIFEFSLNYIKTRNLNEDLFESIYNHKLNDIILNLDINNKEINNKTLLFNLINKTLTPQIVPFLNMYQLNPMKWKSIIDKNNLKDDTLSNINTTDEYKCARCGERKHTCFITQTRCIDEPATIFYTCTVCKKTFTKSM
jgi:DNA-directed RNA polymerase subunit M/transcription elongation factor TFIIS